jgi:hypothetical protein
MYFIQWLRGNQGALLWPFLLRLLTEPSSHGVQDHQLGMFFSPWPCHFFTFCSPQARSKKGIFLPFHYLSQWETFWNSNIYSIYPLVRGSKLWAPTVCESACCAPIPSPQRDHWHEFFSSFVHCMARENPDLWWEMVPHFQTHMGNAGNLRIGRYLLNLT